jgi:hypothetical protein
MAENSDPNSPEYADWYSKLPVSTRAYAATPGSAQAQYQSQLASAPGAATFQNSWMGQGQQPLSAGSGANLLSRGGATPNPLAKVGGSTDVLAGSGGPPPADMRNAGNGGNDVNIGLMPGGAPAGGPATLSTLRTVGGMVNNNPGSAGLVNPMSRGGNNNNVIARPNPGMGIPTMNGAAKSVGVSNGTSAATTPGVAPSLTNPFSRGPASQPTPGGPGSGIPPGNGLANTKVGSVGGEPAVTPPPGTTGAGPGGPLNFNLTYQDYLNYQKAQYGNASEGGGPANLTEDQWNALGQSGQWNQMGGGLAMQSNDPRYAAIAQQLGIKPGTTGPDGTIMFGAGNHPTNTTSANGMPSLVDPNAALQGNGVWATAHPNLTPQSEYSGGGLSDKGWGLAALSVLGGGAALGTALGGAGGAAAAGGSSALQTGGILTGADVAGGTSGAGYIGGVSAGVPGGAAAGSTGSMTGAGPNAGPPEAAPGGAGANGYGTPGGTPSQPFGPELPSVTSPTLDPITQTFNPLGASGGLSASQVYNGARTALGAASTANSLINGGGSHSTPGKVGGPPGTSGGSGDNTGGNDGGDPNGTGSNGLPNWLNSILGIGATALGGYQENKNIQTFKDMSNDLFNKGDYNQAYRPGYLDKLNKAFNDPDSLLQDEGYKNMRADAMSNLSRQEAARGMSLSGNEMGDLTRLQSNMDYNQINNTRQQLMGAANLGDPSGMAKSQMLTLPFLFNAMNNRDASIGASAGRSAGDAGSIINRWLNGGNSGGSRVPNVPNIPGGDPTGLPKPSGNGPNGPGGNVGNPYGPGGMDGGDGGDPLPPPSGSGPNGPGGDVGNPNGPGAGDDGTGSDNWWDDPEWWGSGE